jgi:uncharacterized protein YbbC (DUF1343 family)
MKYSKFKWTLSLRRVKNTVLFSLILIYSCQAQIENKSFNPVKTAAEQTEQYLHKLKGKTIGIVANQTSVVPNSKGEFTHLVDSLLALDISVIKVFAPEHGFRGKADAGEKVEDAIDRTTGLPIISLYGQHKKPTPEDLKGLDLVVFDIQDVGVRFYTYISTLHYVMEACADQNIPILVLDRPNPNRHYVDGPVLEKGHQSFVGMNPVPVVYGMTIGEYARMINGEKWLKNAVTCDLEVVPLKDYNDKLSYDLPVKPSPNLPNSTAVNLYPSLCFFEGTNVNAGRGTNNQFQVFGSPFLDADVFAYQYTPVANEGSKYPKNKDQLCYGKNLTGHKYLSELHLEWLIEAYENTKDKSQFFIPFFTKLAGTEILQQQIEKGVSAERIKDSWQNDIDNFKLIRQKYLMY